MGAEQREFPDHVSLRVDQLADEFELAFRRGNSPRIEDYLDRLEPANRASALRELLKVDIELRRDQREQVGLDDYLARFPGMEAAVHDACRMNEPSLATISHRGDSGAASGTPHREKVFSGSGSGRLEIRCPNCHSTMHVSVDTTLTDLTCESCGSHFSLVDQTKATRIAPSLSRLGRFELIERIGVGGFGSVWKARDKELDRTVAIKVPRAGDMTSEDQEKFFREARAAAQLRHPNIVSVHEVGRDGDSVYIVSDFVRGVTLGDWLTGQQLTGREAAELCTIISDALHHAHEQGVVHRDLKPANIMMDGESRPHLMDFGLARREVGEVTMTMDGQVLGTPAYMSPEQALGEAHTADGRSDIYSIGVILFQLLTGELPFRGNARMIMHQVIHDEPPSPRKLNASISRDLETITLKCLEKSPGARYATTKELADELRRYVVGEPIHARPIDQVERLKRLVQRNKTVSALSAAVAAALLLGTCVSLSFALDSQKQASIAIAREHDAILSRNETEKARQDAQKRAVEFKLAQENESEARRQAEQVASFLVNILSSPDPDRDGRTITVAEILSQAKQRLDIELADQPRMRLVMLDTIAASQRGLGLYDESIDSFKGSLELAEKIFGKDNAISINSMSNLAAAYLEAEKPDAAIPLLTVAVPAARKLLGPEDPETLEYISNLAVGYALAGRPQESIPLYEEVLTAQRKTLAADDPNLLDTTVNLAGTYQAMRRFDAAAPLYESCLNGLRKHRGVDHTTTLIAASNLANCYANTGRLSEAIELHQKTLAARRRKFGDEHPDTLETIRNLANHLDKAGRSEEAIPLRELRVAGLKKTAGVDHPDTLREMNALAEGYLKLDRRGDAQQIATGLLEQGSFFQGLLLSIAIGPEGVDQLIQSAVAYKKERTPQQIDSLCLGEMQLLAGNADAAERTLKAGLRQGEPNTGYCKSLGWCLLAQKKIDESHDAFRKSLASCKQPGGEYELKNADPDQLTAAYFLDLLSESEFVARLANDKRLACLPWFYIAQRREIEGNAEAAIKAYEKCHSLAADANPHSVTALSFWRLSKLTAQGTTQN